MGCIRCSSGRCRVRIAIRTMISGGRCRCMFVAMGVAMRVVMSVSLRCGRSSRGGAVTIVGRLGRCGLCTAMSIRCGTVRVCLRSDRRTGSGAILDADALGRWCSRRSSGSRSIVACAMAGIMCSAASMGRRFVMRRCVSVHCRCSVAFRSVLAGLRLFGFGFFCRLGVGCMRIAGISSVCISLRMVSFCWLGFRCISFRRFGFCSFGLGRRCVCVMAAAMVIMLRIGCHSEAAGEYQREHGKLVNVHDGCPLH